MVFADLYVLWMQLSGTCFATRFELQRSHTWRILAHTQPIPRNGTFMEYRLFGPLRAHGLLLKGQEPRNTSMPILHSRGAPFCGLAHLCTPKDVDHEGTFCVR